MARFCPSCGAAQNAAPAPAEQNATQYVEPACAGNGAVRHGIPASGFSDRVNHPEILAAVKKNRRATGNGPEVLKAIIRGLRKANSQYPMIRKKTEKTL